VLVEGEGAERKLGFEYFPAEPKAKGKDKPEDDEDDDGDDEEAEAPALVEATPRKALSGPKEKKEKPRPGAVPIVPRRKDE
jgi:ATP-dependent Clp protease ATP-binding subunit ClpA